MTPDQALLPMQMKTASSRDTGHMDQEFKDSAVEEN